MTDHDPAAPIRAAITDAPWMPESMVLFISERTWAAMCTVYGAAWGINSDAETYAGTEVDFTAMPFGLWNLIEIDGGTLVAEGRIGDDLTAAIRAMPAPQPFVVRIAYPDTALAPGPDKTIPVRWGEGADAPIIGTVVGIEKTDAGLVAVMRIDDPRVVVALSDQSTSRGGFSFDRGDVDAEA